MHMNDEDEDETDLEDESKVFDIDNLILLQVTDIIKTYCLLNLKLVVKDCSLSTGMPHPKQPEKPRPAPLYLLSWCERYWRPFY